VHTDIPTRADLEQLLSVREAVCVSIYLPTVPEERGERERLEFRSLSGEALEQIAAASVGRDAVNDLRDVFDDLVEDDGFWARQAHSLAIFATPSWARTFQVANRLSPMVEVSDRFHVKPLLRSATFPHAAFVLALSQNAARLVEVSPDAPPVEVSVPGMPSDAASAVGKASIADRSPERRLQGSEGQKVRLRQYARRVHEALRPILTGSTFRSSSPQPSRWRRSSGRSAPIRISRRRSSPATRTRRPMPSWPTRAAASSTSSTPTSSRTSAPATSRGCRRGAPATTSR
jgi:hypothetical protein